MARVIVCVNQVPNDIHLAHGAAVRQICQYPGLDGSVQSLDNGRLLLALTGKMLDTGAHYQSLKVRVKKILAFANL